MFFDERYLSGRRMTETDEKPQERKQAKNLWDWLQLLLLPVILIAGMLWLSVQQYQQSQAILQMNRQQHDTAIKIAADQQQAAILASYREHISDMLLHDKLLVAKQMDTVGLVAQVETLTALRELNPDGKAALMRFLYETKLINNDVHVISLSEADLSGAHLGNMDLRDTYLFGANMRGADLRSANLTYATLGYVDLTGADLQGADLHGGDMRSVNLTNADLRGANLKDMTGLSDDQLAKARSLAGAIMPDGSIHV
jgi:uncharacterized protein YjbI with pentapeptide repeats